MSRWVLLFVHAAWHRGSYCANNCLSELLNECLQFLVHPRFSSSAALSVLLALGELRL
jgi:hypothetical protein